MRTANPVFRNLEKQDTYAVDQTASYNGIIIKTALLLLFAVASGYATIMYLGAIAYQLLFGAMIVAFISVLVSSFAPRLAPVFGVIYAVSEGMLLGVITYIIDTIYPGVAITAVIGTATIFTVMLFLYSSRIIRVTSRFRRIMTSLLLGFLVFFVIFGILSLFNILPEFTIPTGLVLLISGIFIVFGAFMLTLDFDNAERIVEGQADKVYEWVVAVGLMVTLVWIYIELLRFLAILASRRN